jgi:TRAP-type uncharacterized transport system substrate-binding protein
MRRGALRGLNADTAQVAVVNVLATHARVPAEAVREVVAAIVAGADELGQLNALFEGFGTLLEPLRDEGAAAIEFGGVQLHPGAIAAYREAGLFPSEP